MSETVITGKLRMMGMKFLNDFCRRGTFASGPGIVRTEFG